MTKLCCKCGKELKNETSTTCFFCRHKKNLKVQGITNCYCYIGLREKGLLTEKVLEESLKEIDSSFNRELYQKLLWKHQKRLSRHKELLYDPREMTHKEYCEIQKQIVLVTEKPLSQQTHLTIDQQPQQPEPATQNYATLLAIRMHKQQLLEDNGETEKSNTCDLW